MNQIKVMTDKVNLEFAKSIIDKMFGDMVKADVDVAKKLVIVDMPMHYDGEQELLENGSKQKDIWGVNLHPADYGTDDFIEFDSMINIRPGQGNASRDVLDERVRQRIIEIINEVVHE